MSEFIQGNTSQLQNEQNYIKVRNMDEKETVNFEKKQYTVQERKNYYKNCTFEGMTIPCYTSKQMKSLYPKGGYEVAGEYAHGVQTSGNKVLVFEENELPLSKYGANNRTFYQVKGYVAVEPGEDRYVVLLEKVIALRAAVSVLILAVLVVGVALLAGGLRNPNAPANTSAASAVTPELESGAVDWQGIKVSEPDNAPADGIRIPGYKSITIEADKTEVSVNLQNPEQNNCYFVIRLVLLDTGETLYESKMIEPGKGLYTITLTRALKAGTYPAKLQYEPYDKTTLTRLNGADINLELIAE